MQNIFKKLFSAISYVGFFCSFSFILFINLLLGFSHSGFESRGEAFLILLITSALSIGLPLVICFQHHTITKLLNAIDTAYKDMSKNLR